MLIVWLRRSYCPTMMFRLGSATCNFTFAFNAVNTFIKVAMVALQFIFKTSWSGGFFSIILF